MNEYDKNVLEKKQGFAKGLTLPKAVKSFPLKERIMKKRVFKIYWREQLKISKLCRRLKKWCNITMELDGTVKQGENMVGYKRYDSKHNWCLIIEK